MIYCKENLELYNVFIIVLICATVCYLQKDKEKKNHSQNLKRVNRLIMTKHCVSRRQNARDKIFSSGAPYVFLNQLKIYINNIFLLQYKNKYVDNYLL